MAEINMTPTGDAAANAPDPVGARLRRAREAAGLSLAQVSETTRIPMRMLVLIENGDFAALPGRTYATGFTRTYARALGLDEAECVEAVRGELGLSSRAEPVAAPAFEPGDPARVPTARLAWLAALGAIGVIVAGLFFWRTYYNPAIGLPSLLPAEEVTTEAAPALVALPEPVATDGAIPSEAATEIATAAPAAGPARTFRPIVRRRSAPTVQPTVGAPAAGTAIPAETPRAPSPASTAAP